MSVTSDLRFARLRRYVDEEVERWNVLGDLDSMLSKEGQGYRQGRIAALEAIRVHYLLTTEESSAAERLRREILGEEPGLD